MLGARTCFTERSDRQAASSTTDEQQHVLTVEAASVTCQKLQVPCDCLSKIYILKRAALTHTSTRSNQGQCSFQAAVKVKQQVFATTNLEGTS